MPTQYLTQVAQSPNDRVIGDIPLKTLAGLELSRRAQMQTEMAAMNAPNPQMPTVLDSTVQSLSPQPQQPQQPMPPQGMPPPQQAPQQAAPQSQPQQPQPQQQQQQQPPQAKQPPIMGLPSMQGPKKMAGGGIIAFANEGAVPPAEEKATSSIGDFLRSLMEPPEFLRERVERAKDIDYAESQVPSPITAVTPSERARRKEETARVLAGGKRPPETPVSNAVEEDAKKSKEPPKIQNVPDPVSGLAALMKSMGGGGGASRPSKEDDDLRKRILEGEQTGPAQKAFMQNVDRLAPQLENSRPPILSDREASDIEDRQFAKYQTRSKPHFDMMQKLIDEEKAANNAGKESEVYKMLGKMGGALMSSRGAFGPALGRAVGEGIDYNDKADAARAAAERLRRSAQMDLVKARMADEKDDQKSAQAYVTEHDRKIKDAYKIEQEGKIAAMTMRGKAAEFEAGDERSRERNLAALAVSDARRELSNAQSGFARDLALAKYGSQLDAARLKGLPSIAEHYKMQEQADALFANPFQGKAASYLSEIGPEGVNAIRKVEMMGMKPQEALKDAAIASAVDKARAAYINDVLKNTNRVNASSSSVRDGNELYANLPK
jgi:hypothetical protein